MKRSRIEKLRTPSLARGRCDPARVSGLGLNQAPPDHSTISRTRRLIALETIARCSRGSSRCWRRGSGRQADWHRCDDARGQGGVAEHRAPRFGGDVSGLFDEAAPASGIETPTRADLARLNGSGRRKARNNDWRHADPERITKMKDGRRASGATKQSTRSSWRQARS